MNDLLAQTLEKIDEINARDPAMVVIGSQSHPREWLYGHQMTQMLEKHWPDASIELQIAARAQHIARFEVPRSDYPPGRVGYLKWRTFLYDFHAQKAAQIMQKLNHSAHSIERVKMMISKKKLKTDPESLALEDVACLVFLQHYYPDFIENHSDEKVISILQKTWQGMSSKAREIALELELEGRAADLLKKALAS